MGFSKFLTFLKKSENPWKPYKIVGFDIYFSILYLLYNMKKIIIHKMKKTKKRKIGDFGESITALFLKNNGHKIIERNWEKAKIGEIDIVSKLGNIYYFVEVKSTQNMSEKYSPLEHLDSRKMKKFQRIVNHYLIEKNLIDAEYKISAALVYLNPETKKAKINFIEDFY